MIEASGVPDVVFLDANHWYDFLDRGYLDHHEDPLHFSLHNLSVRQKAFLLQLVGTEGFGFNSIAGRTLISELIFAVKDRCRE